DAVAYQSESLRGVNFMVPESPLITINHYVRS
ncbi:MAG: hypothetical protein ACI8XC_003941, partial [Gammaproteobacteria bacterium]